MEPTKEQLDVISHYVKNGILSGGFFDNEGNSWEYEVIIKNK